MSSISDGAKKISKNGSELTENFDRMVSSVSKITEEVGQFKV